MSYINRAFLKQAEDEMFELTGKMDTEFILYITTCLNNERGKVWRTSDSNFKKAWSKVTRYLEKFVETPRWLKIEIQTYSNSVKPSEAIRQISRVKRNNYFPYGIAFKKDGSCSFTSEEIVGNALLTPDANHIIGKNSAKLELNLNNIKGYIKRKYHRIIPNPINYFDDEWSLFQTSGIFIENGNIYPLENEFFGHGIREITEANHLIMLENVIRGGMKYLSDQINEDGSFIYGYYPTYNKRIPGYNSVRHFSSLYALLETLEYSDANNFDINRASLLNRIKAGIDWGLNHLCVEISGLTFVAESVKNDIELKLGAQAMAILAITKYETITNQKTYHPVLLNLLEGMSCFIDEKGQTNHVLTVNLTVKESFRIIYYDGEALFAIMRAYPLIKDEKWLQLGELLIERFIKEKYERYHDHWLSYSVNELTLYLPKKEYYEFGIKNVLNNLKFMENRDTAYPTFLELLCAAIKMFDRIEASQFRGQLFNEEQYQQVAEVMKKRVIHELKTGVMWPEIAQNCSRPDTVLFGFYARHDRMRMRIDDAEHFLSGFVNYSFYISQEKNSNRFLERRFSINDLNYFTGYLLNSEYSEKISVQDFEYFPSVNENFRNENIAFLYLTDEKISKLTGKNIHWKNRQQFIVNNLPRFSLIITEHPIESLADKIAQFIVPDVWEFMHELAEYLRSKFTGSVIGITGSVGKSSTRLMINHLLQDDFQILTNRGNHNTRIATPLYLDKLIQQPDILSIELSLNTLNSKDKGAQSILVRPTIAIITSIDFAHMTGVENLKVIAKVKSRIFEGMNKDGIAIINKDMDDEAFKVIDLAVKEIGCQILTYSMKGNSESDLCLVKMITLKYLTEVTVCYQQKRYTYYLNLSSWGMVENSLATFLTLISLKLNPEFYFSRFLTFESLPKVMAVHSGIINQKEVDIIDDTHNAAVPSMINAINTFSEKSFYYSGCKILALGQIADLGSHSSALHNQLIPYINRSGADYFFGYGPAMKEIVEKVSIQSAWFNNMDEYVESILKVLSEKSLILLKGSVSESDYNQISGRLLRLLNK